MFDNIVYDLGILAIGGIVLFIIYWILFFYWSYFDAKRDKRDLKDINESRVSRGHKPYSSMYEYRNDDTFTIKH